MTRHFFIACAAVVLFTSSGFIASDCATFEPFTKGTQYTTTEYGPTGTVKGTIDGTVNAVVVEGAKTTSTIHVIARNAEGKQEDVFSYNFVCEGGTIRMDLSALATQLAKTNNSSESETSVQGDALEYPAGMTVGQTLPGGSFTMRMKTKSSVSVIKVIVKERKCVAIDTLTTPAGTYECYKITSVVVSTARMGGIEIPVPSSQSIDWFSYKAGAVRTEQHSEGKLDGYTELTRFTKGQ
jgi:hypothetical protein